MSQTNWNDFTPVDDKGAPIKPATVDSGTNWDDFTPAPEPAGLLRKAGDLGLSVAKGVVSVPEAAVGIADIPAGGRVGKFLGNEGGAFGFRPKQAKEYLSSLQSDDLQNKQKQFQQADGVLDKAGVALSNPSLVANAVAESVPLMGAGAVPARALLAAAPRVGAAAAGAIGEGVVGAGSAAEAIRQETPDGLLTPTQSGLAAATGATTSAFGFAGGKVAQRLGIGDVDTMFAQGAARAAGAPSAKSIPRQVVEGAIAEGWLEELPQSVSEQVLQNLALNKPWHEGVSDAAVMGTLAGMAMGGGAAGVAGFSQPTPEQTPPPNQPPPVPPPVAGPTLALAGPDRGVIQVAGDGTARTPAYQAPGYVGDVTDVEAKTPRAQAADFASILDTDNVYSGWSNVQDGSDRATMRDQMDYVGRTYGGKTTPENAAQVASDLAQQFKWFRAASPEQKRTAINALMVPVAPIDPVREQVAAAAEQGGALSSAALTAIDTGLSDAMQPAPEQAPPQISLEEADARDRAAYEQFFASHDSDPVVSRYFENDDDIPDFDAASNASEEDFLRALGATDEDIQDAIATSSQSAIPQSSVASNAGPQAYEPAGPREGAGEGAASQTGQVNAGAIQQAAPDAAVPGVGGAVGADGAGSAATAVSGASGPGGAGTGAATGSGAGATEAGIARAGGRGDSNQALNAPTNLRDALVRVRQQKQEAANAQAAQAPAPAAAPVPRPAAAPAVEAAGPALNIKAITAKQIPDMTDAELQAAIEHYGPAHKRTAKLQKEAQRRAAPSAITPTTTQGNADGPQASQAQQASPKPTQAAAAPAAAAGLTDGAKTANPGAQAAPAPSAQAETNEPEFTTLKTVSGGTVTVRTADLKGDKPRLRQYTKDGKSKAVPAIARDNLDMTGEKRAAAAAENADNPFFNVITTKDGSTFASESAAARELNRIGMGATHEVVRAGVVQDGASGFVIRRKRADAIDSRAEGGANQAEAPTQQAQEATENVASNSTGQDEKSRWLKSVADMNRMSGQFGAQIDGVANGRLSVVGNPNATKQGRALMAAVDEARRAGATNEEIAQAAAGRATTAPQPTSPTAGVPAEGVGAVAAAGVEGATPATAPTIVEVQDKYGRTHRVRQSDLYGNADRIPTVRKNGEVVAGEEIPRSIVKDAPSVAEGLTQVEAEQINQYLTAEKDREEPAATQDADVQPSPQDFIPAPDGGLDYGEITPEMGKAMRRQAGKIRLQHGVQNSNGTGWGLVHIEANHGKQISGLGFGSVQDFVAHVASSIQQVWQVPGNSQLLLTLKDGRKDVMYIQLEIAKEGDFYRVNSAFPVRQEDYESLKGMKKIWDGSEPTSAVTGQRPAFATAASASPESESSQGSSNARGQDASVPPTVPAPQADTPKLTPAEAKSLMAWEDLGQKDGVKTHALTFYESQADKDAKRGRMIVAKVSKEVDSGNWTVEGTGEKLAVLGMAKKKAEQVGMEKAVADGFVEQGKPAPANDRNAFTLQRLNRDTDQMEPVTFERGEYVRYAVGGKDQFGDIDGISQARKEFSVDGLWYPFGFAYKAERPAAPKADTVPLSSVIDKVNAKNGQGLTDADRVPEQQPASKTPTVDRHNATMAAVREGKATAEQFKASFEAVVASKEAIKAELDTMTKVQLLRDGGPFVQMRYANEKKAVVVDAVYREMVGEYALGESVTYSMGKGAYEAAVRKMVEATDADKLANYVAERKAAMEEMQARRAAKAAAIGNPQTLADFREVLNAKIRDGMTRKEAFLTLTPQQRIQYDTLEAESTREARENRKRAQKTEVRAAGQTTAGEIVATKHTRDSYDLFVVKLADRLSKEDYSTVLASAKKLGGWYSAFRGNGAIPGFQFKDKANAEAFLALAGGDTTAAQEQVAQRRDAFEDDRSQTAVERLRAMADKLEEGAAEVEGQERKTNTERRARFASAAMASAAADKAKAQTMRNIARAIEGGEAKFLDAVRTKSQVDMLTGIVDTAKGAELRAKYPSYADQEKRKGEPPTAETADFAEFPSYSAFRSDLATLGRQMLEVDGTKKLGQRLMSVADDVTDAYLEFAKANIQQVSQFGRGDALAEFASKDDAERAIKRSGLTGKAIVLPIKRGQNRVILSPSEAIGRGLWKGDGDKRITLTAEFGAELVEAIGRRGNKQNQLSVPWQFQNAYDRRKALSRIGIETPSEFRAALREFIGLKEQAVANRTRAMELQMVGRKADGLDFFPTSAEVADQMIEAADLTPDMAVLEPSAGMGHLADRIRQAGAEPDVIEISADRRELLEEKGYTTQAVDDFLDLKPREFYTFGDTFRAPDGAEGIMRGANGSRVKLVNETGDMVGAGYYDRADLTGVAHNGTASGYDRIIMNPPFSNRRDAEHVRHAYSLLKPGGRIVAIMGEGVFFGQDKKAQDFREWLESVGGTSEKLPEGSFMDPSLPVNTRVNARMLVIDKPADTTAFSRVPAGLTAEEAVAMFNAANQVSPDARNAQRRISDARLVATQQLIDGIKEKWSRAPEIIVARNMQDRQIPQAVRDYDQTLKSQGATGEPRGFIYKGKVYLLSDELKGPQQIAEVLFHEVLGHYGLRGAFGDGLKPILQQIGTMRRRDVLAKAREYGMVAKGLSDADTWAAMSERDRLSAAEEVLAEMAQSAPEIGFVQRAIAAIRTWLRSNVPGFKNFALTDDEIVRSYIIPARGFVNRSSETPQQALERAQVAFSRGDQDGGTPMFSRAGMADLASKARDELNRTFTAPGKLSWWHKTVGTMYNLAERSPAFKRVFEAAQGFVDDVSYYATDAAEQAPRLLPKLETWRDIAKRPITAADNAAVAKPVFEGTLVWTRDEAGKPMRVDDLVAAAEKLTAEEKARRLLRQDKISAGMLRAWQGLPLEQYEKLVESRYESQMLKAGIVWTPAELKSMFKLTDDQVALYKEFRTATDRSLDTMARSDMLRYGGKDVADLRDMVMDAKDAQDAAQILRDHLQMLAKEDPGRAGELSQLSSGMLDRAAKVQELQEQGYAPLSRFGKYTVDVVDANGERQYFGLFETQREANIMDMKMRKGFGQDAVSQGTLSNEEFKLLAGITPESLELFGNMLGLDSTGDDAQDQAFQEYLRRTKTNRSAMRRLIHRQGIAGYSEDVGRVLASFIYSNARQTSAGLHMGELGEAVTAIPKQQGELKDAAIQLSEYVKNPQEEAQAVRGLLFAQYLGGSIASAFVNMSQPAAVTFPWLSQFGGAKQAAAELGRAAKNLANKGHRYEADLAAALKHAEEEGTVSPQEVHQLMAQARGSGSLRPGDGTRVGEARAAAGNALTRLSLAWGKVFGAAEQVNRRMTFIAAFRVAKAQGMANPAAFAKKAVIETQFTYSKANKMKWGRGAVGATVMTFKTYSVAYLELLGRMWSQGGPEGKKAVLLALGMLMLMGGAGGLPFAEDAEDLVDGLAQLAGYNFNSKKAKQELLESVFGQAGAGFVERGITGLPGMPLDVSGRLGMGNLLPGTGIFKEKTDYTRDVLEVVGPVGDLAKRTASGARSILAGDVGAGLLQMAPAAVRNAAKGADMAATGMYRDDKGYKVLDTSPAEAAMKAIGFQPASVAKVQEANFINQQAKNFYNMKAQEIRAKWARGIFEKDQGIVAEARADLEEWNRKNPEQRIVVSMPAVLKRVREMSKTKDQRIADTAPRAMRQQMQEDAAKARATL